MRKILFLTPSLRLRDGITANSLNFIRGWLESGFEVLVMNPGKTGILVEGLFASFESLDSYLAGAPADLNKTEAEFDADVAVIQYAISTYWLRTYWIHRWLKSTSVKSVVLCCHEPARELQVLKGLGRKIYGSAIKRTNKIVLFSLQAEELLKTLTASKVEIYSLPVPVRGVSQGSKSGHPHFLMLGYYFKDKGFELGLNAFAETLKASNTPIVLSVIVSLRERVGSARFFSGRDRRDFEKFQLQLSQIKENSPNNVSIYGYLTDAEMENVISSSDYLLMPYLDITNSGVAVTAKAHGIPVISSDLKPLVETFGESAIYFKSGSSTDLKTKLEGITRNSNWNFDREMRANQMLRLAGTDSAAILAVAIIDT